MICCSLYHTWLIINASIFIFAVYKYKYLNLGYVNLTTFPAVIATCSCPSLTPVTPLHVSRPPHRIKDGVQKICIDIGTWKFYLPNL